MFAQWDDHEVTNDWSPIGSFDDDRLCRGRRIRSWSARARQAFHEFMPIRAIPEQDGRVYRKIAYGPLLDVFLIDMRSYRDSTWNKRDDRGDTFILGPDPTGVAEARTCGSDATWKVIAADLPIGLDQRGRGRAGRWSAGAARARDRRSAVVHETRRHPQHRLADRRHALHGRASLRSEPRAVPGFRTVLGIRLGPAACRDLGARRARQYLRSEGDVSEGLQRRSRAKISHPCFGLQFFGRVDIDGKTEVMTVTLKDVDDRELWSVDIEPRPDARLGRVLSQHF